MAERKRRAVIGTGKAAKYMGVSRETIRELLLSGQLQGFKVNRHFKVYVDSIDTFMSDNPAKLGAL